MQDARVAYANYKAIAAGQTDVVIANGQPGEFLEHILVIPATTTPGNIVLKDGANTILTTVFGTLADTKPFLMRIGARATQSGGWKVTTGSNVSVVVVSQ
jgi:hypothetical protein